MGRADVRRYVEDSDCLILLGAFMTDIDLGIYTAKLDPDRWIFVTSEDVRIRHHHFHDVLFPDFVNGLLKAKIEHAEAGAPADGADQAGEVRARTTGAKITTKRLLPARQRAARRDTVVVADVGDSLFGASDLVIHRDTEFLSPAYYTSMGFAIPAAIGVQVANREAAAARARRRRRVSDDGHGALDGGAAEVQSDRDRAQQQGLHDRTVSAGRAVQRHLRSGASTSCPTCLGGGVGMEVRTEGDLEQALATALVQRDSFSILNVHLEPDDISPALQRLASSLRKRI